MPRRSPTVRELFKQAVTATDRAIPKQPVNFSQRAPNGTVKQYCLTEDAFRKALARKFADFDAFAERFTKHLLGQKNIVAAFASTPVSFSDAWNMQVDELSAEDVLSLSHAGGHFQFNQVASGRAGKKKDGPSTLSDPARSGSLLYLTGQARGLVKSKGLGLTKGLRHKTGGIYEEDALSEMGVFTYASPTDAAGMMELRFAENFSRLLRTPLIYVITQWFRYVTECEEHNQWLYMTGIAKVVTKSRQRRPNAPIQLQLISKELAVAAIDNLLDALRIGGDYQVKPIMPDHLRLGWSYDKIASEPWKKKAIVDYAQQRNLRCPGTACHHQPFRGLKPREIHVGHRISQKWHRINVGVVDVHHPYNLYLSCHGCNTSLQDKYPAEIDEHIASLGTIGDWLMSGDNVLLDAISECARGGRKRRR